MKVIPPPRYTNIYNQWIIHRLLTAPYNQMQQPIGNFRQISPNYEHPEITKANSEKNSSVSRSHGLWLQLTEEFFLDFAFIILGCSKVGEIWFLWFVVSGYMVQSIICVSHTSKVNAF